MYITSDRTGGQGGFDLWVLKRYSIDVEWGPQENIGPAVNTTANDFNASKHFGKWERIATEVSIKDYENLEMA